MCSAIKYRMGTTLGFVGDICRESFELCAQGGIKYVELSYDLNDLLNKYDFLNRAVEYAETAAGAGVQIWSLHLPYGGELDASYLNGEHRAQTVDMYMKLMGASASAGIRTIVMHASTDTVADEERNLRLEACKDSLAALNEFCRSLSLTLAVENLPRSCLCNTGAEAIELLSPTGTALCFDTNHSLKEDNSDFLRNITAAGLSIGSVHISDYDGVNSRHWIPGDGAVKWPEVINLIKTAGYCGPLIYEVNRESAGGRVLSLDDLIENQRMFEQAYL